MRDGKRLYVATSGWYYDHWKGPFYPEDLPKNRFLEYYSERFNTVEINNSFYRLPEESTIAEWRDKTPDDFAFSVKASRLITHIKRLKDPGRTLPNFLDRIKAFGDKLGPILFQLPPKWNVNTERLREFLDALPKDNRYTFEFRDISWFTPKVYDMLAEYNAALCMYDFNHVLSPRKLTADFAYMRLHGPNGPYRGQYTDEVLEDWADAFTEWFKDVDEIYCYFDNDEAGYAAKDALRLIDIYSRKSHGKIKAAS